MLLLKRKRKFKYRIYKKDFFLNNLLYVYIKNKFYSRKHFQKNFDFSKKFEIVFTIMNSKLLYIIEFSISFSFVFNITFRL